ncbi:MAG TPA: alpha/beta fold hydrolase [Mycobacterium sp.]|nr:alpha/beta fold hydrolase [Mycobacterium sp.]
MTAQDPVLHGPASGYHDFHPDRSLNFQCNRWLEWIGPEAHDEIAAAVRNVGSYEEWIDAFLSLATRTRAEGRELAAAYCDRAAEFFIPPQDPRKAAARARFLKTMREQYGVQPDRIPYQGAWLPAYDLQPGQTPTGPTVVVFGGYDSYIEEFLPMLTAIAAAGHRVVAFEGPGQGSALEDAGLVLTHEWERPMAAVLDHYGLDDVTAVGISLGGGLVIRAAAFEPRIRRAVAWDILDDFLEAVGRQVAPGAAQAIRALLVLRAGPIVNAAARARAARSPVVQWALWQGMHITGTTSPYDFMASARALTTRSISGRVTADVLLIAGADDHYVPLHQLHRQARNLTAARSVTTRVFTAAEQASNHCQIGNTGACIRTILAWADTLTSTARPNRIST